ncbi:MAG: DUF3047 domain-containing protein [Usitatibacter sp.]
MRAAAALVLATASFACAQDSVAIPAFSTAAPGAQLPGGWRSQRLPKAAPAELAMVNDGGATVLRVRSIAAAGGAVHALHAGAGAAAHPLLSWRWKIDRVVDQADMTRRSGDDYAARVYVFFAVPMNELAFRDRLKILLARILYGEELPTAGICYVWDNRHPAGATAWSPYTDRIRMVVVESGSARAGQWTEVRRDLEADFRAAFAAQGPKPVPAVTGIAAGNDTDQTGEAATAWFGDFRMEARR